MSRAGVEGRVCSVVLLTHRASPRVLELVKAFKGISGGQLAVEPVVCIQGNDPGSELRAAGATVIRLPAGLGYAASIEEALLAVQYEMVALFDPGDGYDPHDLPRLMSQAARHDMVVGVRQSAGKSPVGRRFVRWSLRRLAELVTGKVVPDATSGFRIVRRGIFTRYAPLALHGSGLSSMLTIGMLTDGLAVAYVPVQYQGSPSGRRRPLRAWLELLHLMLRISLMFNPLRVFSMPGYTLLFAGSLLLGISALSSAPPYTWSVVSGALCLAAGFGTLAVAFLADVLGGLSRAILTQKR